MPISPAIDLPSYTGSVSMPSERAARWMASIVTLVGDAVDRAGVAVDDRDLVGPQRSVDADPLGGVVGDPGHLVTVWSSVLEASMPMTRRRRGPSRAKPAIIPAWVDPVTVHTTTWSKNTSSSASWAATSRAQLAKPSPPSGWSDAPAGIGYGLPPAAVHGVQRPPPAVPHADVEPGLVHADVAAHDARQLHVADLAVLLVGPVDPVLLHRHAARPRWQATPVTARVWLDWMPPIDTSVSQPWASASATRYSSLRTLLPPKAMPGVAVLPLRPDLDAATQRRAEARQRVDRRRAEQQRDASKSSRLIAAS